MELSLKDAAKLVKIARHSIELSLKSPLFDRKIMEKEIEYLKEKRGVFVNIEHFGTSELRGSIGSARPSLPLNEAVIDAAITAATQDPKFVPLSHKEFDHILISVILVSRLAKISGTQIGIKSKIKIGRDGLLIEYGFHSGSLLPEMPVQAGWTKEQYLENLCLRASLPEHTWKKKGVEIYKFTTLAFKEKEPYGEVEEITNE